MDALFLIVAAFLALAVGIWLDVKKVDRIWCFVIGVLFALLIVVLIIEVLPAEAAGVQQQYLPLVLKNLTKYGPLPTPAPTMPVPGTPMPFPTPATPVP